MADRGGVGNLIRALFVGQLEEAAPLSDAGEVAAAPGNAEFLERLRKLTAAAPPGPPPAANGDGEQPGEGEQGGSFDHSSWRNLLPVVVTLVRLLWHLAMPYVCALLLGSRALGFGPAWLSLAGAAFLGYLCVFDEQFALGFLGRRGRVAAGLHCRPSARNRALAEEVPALRPPYYTGTSWLRTGDVRTLYPFLAFAHPGLPYLRRWLTVEAGPRGPGETQNGGSGGGRGGGGGGSGIKAAAPATECVALDIALPEGGLEGSGTFVLVLHGLNGGSSEPYVLDVTRAALARGVGVCVLIARGLMDTRVHGPELFHGARTSDVKATVMALREALPADTRLGLVGFSMGGIIAANYVAKEGEEAGVCGAVCMAGGLDTRVNKKFWHSRRLWLPVLAHTLKVNFVTPYLSRIRKRGLDLSRVERAWDVVDFDTEMVAKYHGYQDVDHYYRDMSAGAEGKLLGLHVPLLAVHALDDPIMTVECCSPQLVAQSDNLFVLITRHGGHVGWPLGWRPTRHKWSWMSNTALDFCQAVARLDGDPDGHSKS